MRAAVTGAAGFIGSYLSRAIAERGDEVVAIDNYVRGRPERVAGHKRVTPVTCDVRDGAALAAAIEGVDVVFHLAAVNGTQNFYDRPELVLDVGVRGILAVVEACRSAGIRDLVVASSAEVYQTPDIVPTDETVTLVVPDPLNPRYSYGGSKLVSELIALNYAQEHFRKLQIFRPHNVYGADMGWKHVIPQIVRRVVEVQATGGTELSIQGDGSETRAFCHVDDIVAGILLMYERGEHRAIYHIGSMEEVSIHHLTQSVLDIFAADLTIVPGPAMTGGTPRRCPDTSKMAALGYAPAIPLSVGLAQTAAWYRDNAEPVSGNELL